MFKILVVEDELYARESLIKLLREYDAGGGFSGGLHGLVHPLPVLAAHAGLVLEHATLARGQVESGECEDVPAVVVLEGEELLRTGGNGPISAPAFFWKELGKTAVSAAKPKGW